MREAFRYALENMTYRETPVDTPSYRLKGSRVGSTRRPHAFVRAHLFASATALSRQGRCARHATHNWSFNSDAQNRYLASDIPSGAPVN